MNRNGVGDDATQGIIAILNEGSIAVRIEIWSPSSHAPGAALTWIEIVAADIVAVT